MTVLDHDHRILVPAPTAHAALLQNHIPIHIGRHAVGEIVAEQAVNIGGIIPIVVAVAALVFRLD